MAVACHAGEVLDDGLAAAEDAVEQRGLAHIGAPDDGDVKHDYLTRPPQARQDAPPPVLTHPPGALLHPPAPGAFAPTHPEPAKTGSLPVGQAPVSVDAPISRTVSCSRGALQSYKEGDCSV